MINLKKTGDVSGMAKENDCMSQYFRIEEECVDCRWPQAGLYSNNTIFVVEDNLEEFMKQKCSVGKMPYPNLVMNLT